MPLADFQIPRERITLPGKPVNGVKPFVEVRGICADDLTYLLQRHLGPITRAVKLWQESKADIIRTGTLQQFMLVLLKDFPDITAEVISCCADEIDDAAIAVARKLPIASQLACLSAIFKLTQEDAGGLGNLLAEFRQRLESAVSVANPS